MAATYNLISSQVLGSSTASVTFSSIPQTYTDLVLRISARSDYSSVLEQFKITFNGDSSAIYSYTYLRGNGAAASSSQDLTNTYALGAGGADGNTSTASTFGNAEIYLPNYTSTTSKPLSFFGANETNATNAYLTASANLYRNTTAISSILIAPAAGSNWLTNSSFYLYGLKSS